MLPYWFFFGLFAVAALLARADIRPGTKVNILWIGLPVLMFMIGFRYYVGPDYANYLRAWDVAGTVSLDNYYERRPGDPLFYTIVWIMKNLGWPYWSLNLFCGAIFSFGLVQFARQQPNGWLAIAVAVPYLVIVIAMSGIRQATAMGFIFMALASYRRSNLQGFVGWTVVGAMFHASAILVLPFGIMSIARNHLQSVLLLLLTLVGGYFLFGSTFGEYSKDYLRSSSTSSGTAYRIAMSFFPAVFYLLLKRRMRLSEHERVLWRNFALLSIVSVPLLFVVKSSTALDRLLLYAFPLQILMLSWLPYFFSKSVEQVAIKLGILAYLSLQLFVFLNYAVNAGNFVPYATVLFSGPASVLTALIITLICAWVAVVAKGQSSTSRTADAYSPVRKPPAGSLVKAQSAPGAANASAD